MSFEISEEVLKALEEKLREFRARTSSGIPLGEEKQMIIIDACVRNREVVLACLLPNGGKFQERLLIARIDDKLTDIVRMLEELKCVELRAKVFGNRITEIVSYCEYVGKLPPKYMGVLRRARSGVRYWLDTIDGKDSYLISDYSIKGMKLNGEAGEGDIVVMYAFEPDVAKNGIKVITYLHYQIVKKAGEETVKEEEEKTSEAEEVEVEKITKTEIEKIAQEEAEIEEGNGRPIEKEETKKNIEEKEETEEETETEVESEVEESSEDRGINIDRVKSIVKALLGENAVKILFKDENNVKMCIDYTREMRELILCLIDNAELSRKMKEAMAEKVRKSFEVLTGDR